jgi:hypothetical protein
MLAVVASIALIATGAGASVGAPALGMLLGAHNPEMEIVDAKD